jgi:hypothetical protein
MKLLKTSLALCLFMILLNACIKTNTNDSSTGSGLGTGSFTVGGQTYTGDCVANADPNCSGKLLVQIVSPNNGSYNLYAVSTSSSGSTNLVVQNTSNRCIQNSICNLTGSSLSLYGSVSGSVTRTGANSLSFTSTMKSATSTQQVTITGSGSWK